MLEKRFYAIAPQLLTSNGSVNGYVTINNACILLKVKQVINVTDTLGNLRTYEVKRIDGPDRVYLGPIGKPLIYYDDLSAYTTANGAFLFADEQQRTKIAEQEIPRAVYQEEPAVAVRSILVDDSGKTYGQLNPLPVQGTVADVINGPGLETVISVTSTPIEVKVGASKLTNRKLVTVFNDGTATVYWGYNNTITASTGTHIFKNQLQSWDATEGASIWLVAASGSHSCRITESA